MANQAGFTAEALDGYINADEKYFISPLPTRLDRSQVTRRILTELSVVPDLPTLRRLSKLAIFYNARKTSDAFQRLYENPVADSSDPQVALLGIGTIGWIGTEDQKQKAIDSFGKWMAQHHPDRTLLRAVVNAYQGFGTYLSADRLFAWIQGGENDLKNRLKQARSQKNEAKIDEIENLMDELSYFTDREIKTLVSEVQTRGTVESMPVANRIQWLALHYLEDSEGSSKEMSFWSAIRLVRLVEAEPSHKPTISESFIGLSKEYHHPRVPLVPDDDADLEEEPEETETDIEPESLFEEDDSDEDMADTMDEDEEEESPEAALQREVDLVRATCLRAAMFFGGTLNEDDAAWLKEQEDPGLDLLALRPDWKYTVR